MGAAAARKDPMWDRGSETPPAREPAINSGRGPTNTTTRGIADATLRVSGNSSSGGVAHPEDRRPG